MKSVVKKTLKYTVVLLAVLLLIPAGYLAYLYVTYLDVRLTSGSGYGFTIGQSKWEAYEAAQREFRAGRIVGINTVHDRDDELRAHPWLDDDLAIADARGRFPRWDHWDLWLYDHDDRASLLVVVVFDGEGLSGVGQPGTLGTSWHPADFPALEIRQGQTREEVFAAIESLSRLPGYDGLRLSTGWMARRQPKTFAPVEFEFVEADEDWTLLVDHKWSYFNTVDLRFSDGRLAEIHRHRQYFELP